MKYFTFIPALLLSLTSVNALAGKNTCRSIEGYIEPLKPDSACNILNEKPNYFPDVRFLDELGVPDTCFSGGLTATLVEDNTQINGTAFSALTYNEIGQLTVVSAIRLLTNNPRGVQIELGQIFTKDVVFNPEVSSLTKEALAVVGGSKKLKNVQGSLEIHGNALQPTDPDGVPFTGRLCY